MAKRYADQYLQSLLGSSSSPDDATSDARTAKVVALLQDASISEDDLPEQLKSALCDYLPNEPDLDNIVLQVLHRHRADVNGEPFHASTPTGTKSLSRSSSVRRPFTPTLSAGQRHPSERFVPSRPHSPSPLRLHKSTDSFPELNVAASEFRPRTPVSVGHNSPQLRPLPHPGDSSNPWGYGNSPLGTPKGLYPGSNTANDSPLPSPSYFATSPLAARAQIPRDPWAPPTGHASTSSESSYDEPSDPYTHTHPPNLAEDDGGWPNQRPPPSSVPDTGGLTGTTAAYSLTPLDLLYSVFADSGIALPELEDALGRNGWDVDRAMEDLMSSRPLPHNDELSKSMHLLNVGSRPGTPSYGRPAAMARDGFPGGFRTGSPGPRNQRPLTPNGLSPSYPSAAATNRVCRYYLQGNCMRSDCRYNHDISKAICRFWLKGHCLKGPDRCDFMHMIPPHLAQDVAVLRMRISTNERRNDGYDSEGSGSGRYTPRHLQDDEEDFPTLGAPSHEQRRRRDPATTRWASAVKSNNRPVQSLDQPSSYQAIQNLERPSPRINLRPPLLMPTIATGSSVSESYSVHRQKFLDLGAARARCLSKAAEAYRRGDGAGAKYWSREAQTQDLDRLQAGREAAEAILTSRRKALKDAVLAMEGRDGRVDPTVDRMSRGKEMGNGLGVCLGTAIKMPGAATSAEERTEVCIDLHGLHAEEATDVLSRFFAALERESFYGIAYLVTGLEKHSVQGQVRTRLNDAVTEFLNQYKYPWRDHGNGIRSVDPLEHI